MVGDELIFAVAAAEVAPRFGGCNTEKELTEMEAKDPDDILRGAREEQLVWELSTGDEPRGPLCANEGGDFADESGGA